MSGIFIGKLTVAELVTVKYSLPYTKTKASLVYSEEPATGHSPNPD
jgi:hypothetical protein